MDIARNAWLIQYCIKASKERIKDHADTDKLTGSYTYNIKHGLKRTILFEKGKQTIYIHK